MKPEALGELRGSVSCRAPQFDDPSIDGMQPTLVAQPTDVEELCAAMRVSHAHRLAVVPVGSGSRLSLGNRPRSLDVMMSTRLVSGIADYEPGDLTVSARAGTSLGELQRTLGEEGQFLPVDPPGGPRETLGGLFAVGEWGSRRQPGARPRDLLVGFDAALADGRLVKAGGRVVKNVAGYELTKLMVGSAGTLGVLTKLCLRARALPETVAIVEVRPSDVESLSAAVAVARHLRLGCEAMAASSTSHRAGGASGPTLWCRFEGLWEEVEAAVEGLLQTLHTEVGRHDIDRLDPDEASSTWDAVHRFPVSELKDGGLSFRLQTDPASTVSTAIACENVGGGEWIAFPETGLVYGRVDEAASWDRWRTLASELKARWVVDRAPVDQKPADVYGELPSGFALMRSIKQTMDPDSVLSPGRFVGGL